MFPKKYKSEGKTFLLMIDFSLVKIVPADASHYDFVYRLKKDVYGGYIGSIWGWDEDVQREFFAKEWERHIPDIILYDDRPIGTYCCIRNEDSYHLERFYILPEYQNKGIGTYILKDILDMADGAGLPVRLMWLNINPAASLYMLVGFKVTGKLAIDGKEEYFVLAERKPSYRNKDQTK
jgi:GNAT superfamily N-acetyltransferase